jgi:PAS domain S-box-containing protein
VLLADPSSQDCYVVASKGHPEARMMELALERYPEVRQALATRQAVVVDDVATDPLLDPSRDVLLAQGYRSMLVLPLLFGHEVVGALFLKSRKHGRFDPEVQRFCRVVACVSANALKNAMLYRDVTREAARHRETGEKLRRVLDGTPDMILATDAEGRITQFNRGAENLSGHDAGWAIGRRLSEVLQNDLDGEAQAGARDVSFERRDGARVEVSLLSAPLTGVADEPVGRVWIGRDVTKLRGVERRLVQAERLSSLGEVVAGVAHELNNPLSAVVGYAELLRSSASDPEQIGDLQRIVE